jgi:hypothetical protein
MGVLRRREESSERGLNTESCEVVSGGEVAPDAMCAAGVTERNLSDAIAEHRLKYRVAVANVTVVGERIGWAARVVDGIDSLRIGHRERFQNQGIEDAEDDGVCADAQRHR